MPFQKSRRCDDGHVGAGVNFHVTVLKILVSYPDGFAAMEDLKRDMAILATSGRDWTEAHPAARRAGAGAGHLFARADRPDKWRVAHHGQGPRRARSDGSSSGPSADCHPTTSLRTRACPGDLAAHSGGEDPRTTRRAPSPTQCPHAGSGVLARNERRSRSLSKRLVMEDAHAKFRRYLVDGPFVASDGRYLGRGRCPDQRCRSETSGAYDRHSALERRSCAAFAGETFADSPR